MKFKQSHLGLFIALLCGGMSWLYAADLIVLHNAKGGSWIIAGNPSSSTTSIFDFKGDSIGANTNYTYTYQVFATDELTLVFPRSSSSSQVSSSSSQRTVKILESKNQLQFTLTDDLLSITSPQDADFIAYDSRGKIIAQSPKKQKNWDLALQPHVIYLKVQTHSEIQSFNIQPKVAH